MQYRIKYKHFFIEKRERTDTWFTPWALAKPQTHLRYSSFYITVGEVRVLFHIKQKIVDFYFTLPGRRITCSQFYSHSSRRKGDHWSGGGRVKQKNYPGDRNSRASKTLSPLGRGCPPTKLSGGEWGEGLYSRRSGWPPVKSDKKISEAFLAPKKMSLRPNIGLFLWCKTT